MRIRDNGMGIAESLTEKMYNPFFTTKPAGEGTGLGLSISHYIIVKQHGGTISVDTREGEFTEFTIVLPRNGILQEKIMNGVFPSRVWGGTQDNGTLGDTRRRPPAWTDVSSGDGGQVLVDPNGLELRLRDVLRDQARIEFDNGGAFLFSNQSITQEASTSQMAPTSTPMGLNQRESDQLFLGTFRALSDRQCEGTDAGQRDLEGDQRRSDGADARESHRTEARNCSISAFGVGRRLCCVCGNA